MRTLTLAAALLLTAAAPDPSDRIDAAVRAGITSTGAKGLAVASSSSVTTCGPSAHSRPSSRPRWARPACRTAGNMGGTDRRANRA